MTLLVDRPEGMRIVISNRWVGFFAQLSWVTAILVTGRRANIPVQIACTGQHYVSLERGPNFIDYFFTDLRPADRIIPPSVPWTTIREISEVLANLDTLRYGFDEAHRAFFERYAFRPWVDRTIEALLRGRPEGSRLIGVHYRGTDKRQEAPRVAYPEMLAIIDRELDRSPNAHVFVATDEADFLDAVRGRYGERLIFLRDYARSIDGKALHYNRELDGFYLGRDAVLNCALLSRCDIVIKTPSFLSGWAKIINPGLDVFLVTRPYDKFARFPDKDLPSYPTS